MKKIILIGKFNEVTKEINDCLSPLCQVQLCPDAAETAKGIIRIARPSLAVVSLVGAPDVHEDIFSLLFREFRHTPILAIGSQEMEEKLRDSGFMEGDRIQFLGRPMKAEEITRRVRELLGEEPEPAPEPEPEEEPQQAGDGKKTIMVVDDSPAFLRTMQAMLAPVYRVVFATSGPQALTVIAKGKPDLILLDYEMPVCDGKMTLQMLRSEESTKDIPVIFLTGMADAKHVQELLALLPNDYLLKPPSEERLFKTIESILNGSRQGGRQGIKR